MNTYIYVELLLTDFDGVFEVSNKDEEYMDLAIKIISRYVEEGIPQEKFIEELGIDSKDAIKLISKLIKKGIIRKETKIINNKKVTFLYSYDKTLSIPVNLDSLSKVPCFKCKYLLICKPGSNPNPAECTLLDDWLINELSLIR